MAAATKPFRLVAIDLDGTTVAESEDMGTGSEEVDEQVFPGTVEAAMQSHSIKRRAGIWSSPLDAHVGAALRWRANWAAISTRV